MNDISYASAVRLRGEISALMARAQAALKGATDASVISVSSSNLAVQANSAAQAARSSAQDFAAASAASADAAAASAGLESQAAARAYVMSLVFG